MWHALYFYELESSAYFCDSTYWENGLVEKEEPL